MRKAHALFFFVCLISFLLGSSLYTHAQVPVETDTVQRPQLEGRPVPLDKLPNQYIDDIDTVSKLIPAKAAFYSAVLPGMGQAYNGSHWKIPIIYIGGAFVAYSVNFYNREYSQSLRNFHYLRFEEGETEINGRDADFYQRRATLARRQRDYTIILGTLLYGLNIVEAYVDAHLQDFDLNDDLAMQIKPAMMAGSYGQPGAGIALTLHFK